MVLGTYCAIYIFTAQCLTSEKRRFPIGNAQTGLLYRYIPANFSYFLALYAARCRTLFNQQVITIFLYMLREKGDERYK